MKKKTQKQNVIYHLKNIGPLTPLDALRLYGVFRLGAIIHTLRHEECYDISTTLNKGDKNYAIYKLESDRHLDGGELSDKDGESKQQGLGLLLDKKYKWPD